MHEQLSNGGNWPNVCLNIHLFPYLVYKSSKGSGDTVPIRLTSTVKTSLKRPLKKNTKIVFSRPIVA